MEGTFARIERHGAIGTEWWEVATKDGLVSRYGARSGGGAVTPDDEALVRDPLDTTRVFAWSLTETVDPFGNRVEYGYTLDAPADAEAHAAALAAGHCFNRRLPLLVQYADVADGAGVRFVVSVHFEYEDRPDPFSDYRAGFELRTTRRCKRIVVATHADAATAQGVRAYEFVYQDEIDELDVPANGASLLSKILVGSFADGVVPEQPASEPALPPLEFSYARFDPRRRRFRAVEGPDLPPDPLASPARELVDVTGDGLPDLVELNGVGALVAEPWRKLQHLTSVRRRAHSGQDSTPPACSFLTRTATDAQICSCPLRGGITRWDRVAAGNEVRSGGTGSFQSSTSTTPRCDSWTWTGTA